MTVAILTHTLSWAVNGDLPGGAPALLKSITSSDAAGGRPRLMAGDKALLHLYFLRADSAVGSPPIELQLEDESVLSLVGKQHGFLKNGPVLFEVSNLKLDDDEGVAVTRYAGELDLDTVPIRNLFDVITQDSFDVDVDLEYRSAGGDPLTYRLEFTLCRQSYASGSVPSLVAPSCWYRRSPSGYVYKFSITDDGDVTKERMP